MNAPRPSAPALCPCCLDIVRQAAPRLCSCFYCLENIVNAKLERLQNLAPGLLPYELDAIQRTVWFSEVSKRGMPHGGRSKAHLYHIE